MRLVDRNGEFWTHRADRHGVGLTFRCPCRPDCDLSIFVVFTNPVDGGPPEPTARATWQRSGDTIDTLTLTPSIDFHHVVDATSDPRKTGWHGFVRDGALITC